MVMNWRPDFDPIVVHRDGEIISVVDCGAFH